jgi:hypothetical protein
MLAQQLLQSVGANTVVPILAFAERAADTAEGIALRLRSVAWLRQVTLFVRSFVCLFVRLFAALWSLCRASLWALGPLCVGSSRRRRTTIRLCA